MKHITILFAIAATLFAACTGNEEKSQVKERVSQFALYYFNCKYKEALPLCTSASEKWLRYAASNITQEDIDVLNSREEEASCEVADVDFTDDSTSVATLDVQNFFVMDSIGQAGIIVPRADIKLTLRFTEGEWKVDLNSLPRQDKGDR